MDTDVAYLLGMCFGRGQLIEQGNDRQLIITLKIRRKLPKLPPGFPVSIDLDRENERCLNRVQSRVGELLDANVAVQFIRDGEATLSAVFARRTIGWRDLKILTSGGTDNGNFHLPKAFFSFPKDIWKEFLRGFADVAVMPSYADNEFGRKCRVAFPVVHRNEVFAKQLERLFAGLGIKAPRLAGSPAKRGGAKEHRIRPYAEAYEPVGFHFEHKNQLLKVLADYNRKLAKKPKTK